MVGYPYGSWACLGFHSSGWRLACEEAHLDTRLDRNSADVVSDRRSDCWGVGCLGKAEPSATSAAGSSSSHCLRVGGSYKGRHYRIAEIEDRLEMAVLRIGQALVEQEDPPDQGDSLGTAYAQDQGVVS